MRRLIAIAMGIAALAAGAGALLTGGASAADGEDAGGTYRVDVIFDNARGLLPGQLVEIAGARVGEIDDVVVTHDFKARIQMTVDGRFAPFGKDATGTIRPQGLIAENYVQCDPGSPDSEELRGRGGQPPTVPVDQTTQPVNLTDVFEIWNVPTRDRLQVLLSELGIASAARGPDINDILRRANPALKQANAVISLLEEQKESLLAAVDATDTAVAGLAEHRGSLQRLLRSSARILTRTGSHAGDLSATVQRLPGLLESARPALTRLGELSQAGIPLLAQLHRSAPQVIELTKTAPALAEAARPVLAKSGPVLDYGAGVVKRSVPLTKALSIYADQALPSAKLAGELLPNLSQRGFPDNLMRFFYHASIATARFDDVSHILPAHVVTSPCQEYATTPQPGCSANYQTTSAASRRVLDYLLEK
jgi:ABC-type transporter Mla subunit MlaD